MASKTILRYHFVFVTKYRKKALEGIEAEVLDALERAAGRTDFEILESSVEDGNHVHLLVEAPATRSVASVAQALKQLSTRYLYESHNSHLKKFYWGKKRVLWSGGYFASTVGAASEKVVRAYILKAK